MLTEFLVEGVNFVAIVPVETDLFDAPYMEAATRALEYMFRPPQQRPKEFLFLIKKNISPKVGGNLHVWKNGDLNDDKKMHPVKFVDAAKNASLHPNYVRWLETI